MKSVIEQYRFKLTNQSSTEAFLQANEVLNEWVNRQPGFLYRSLAVSEEGEWLDSVYWDSKQNAEQAQARFKQELSDSPFCKMIDEQTVSLIYAESQIALQGAA